MKIYRIMNTTNGAMTVVPHKTWEGAARSLLAMLKWTAEKSGVSFKNFFSEVPQREVLRTGQFTSRGFSYEIVEQDLADYKGDRIPEEEWLTDPTVLMDEHYYDVETEDGDIYYNLLWLAERHEFYEEGDNGEDTIIDINDVRFFRSSEG